jgi:hypothetical protein
MLAKFSDSLTCCAILGFAAAPACWIIPTQLGALQNVEVIRVVAELLEMLRLKLERITTLVKLKKRSSHELT